MIYKPLKKQNSTYKNLALAVGFCFSVLLIRIKLTQSLFYSFLAWNLFLAVLPYCITQLMEYSKSWRNSTIKMGSLFTIWLLLLPNSPYIITDLVHLHNKSSTLLWLDLFLVFVFALTGLLFGLLSLIDMNGFIRRKYSNKIASKAILGICILIGYGIYLGRFLRFNSWDVFTRPFFLFEQIISSLTKPKVWAVSLAFGCLIWILFLVMRSSFIEYLKQKQN